MSQSSDSSLPRKRSRKGQEEELTNSLRPARRNPKAQSDPTTFAASQKQKATKHRGPAPVPEEVRKRFVQIKNIYFFADGAKAFMDRGDRLTTQSENTEVVRSLIAIAQARGWSEVAVRGTKRFRREAWVAARASGMEERGYKPTEFEQGRLVRSLASRDISKGWEGAKAASSESPRAGSGTEQPDHGIRRTRAGLLTGTLVEHGRAPYQHDMKQPMSYYVKFETPQGDRTIWGVDLERAFKESLSRPAAGDKVGLRSIRQEPVKVKTADRDGSGTVVGEKDLETHRNRWIVEKRAFFEERAEAARVLRDTSIDPKKGGRMHPELVGTYLQVHAAELAAKQLRDPQDRQRFVEKVREALATSVARGEPLSPVRLREERAPENRTRPVRTAEPELARA